VKAASIKFSVKAYVIEKVNVVLMIFSIYTFFLKVVEGIVHPAHHPFHSQSLDPPKNVGLETIGK
jgi:hypothetical protein